MSNFHVGQKVKCVQGVRPHKYGHVSDRSLFIGKAADPNYPEKGKTYTVRNVNDIGEDYDLLLLSEVDNSHLTDFIRAGLEPGFKSIFFRAVKQTVSA